MTTPREALKSRTEGTTPLGQAFRQKLQMMVVLAGPVRHYSWSGQVRAGLGQCGAGTTRFGL